MAGELRNGRGATGALYDLKVRHCKSHFAARLAHGNDRDPLLLVGLRQKPGQVVSVPVDEERNQVELEFNPDIPLDLRLDLGAGRHTAALGGLDLRGLAVSCGSGALTLDFDVPERGELDQVTFDGGTGPLRILRLGNASPSLVSLRGGSGLFGIDLRGAWRRDAMVQIDVRLGDVTLDLPRGLAVEIRASGRDPDDLVLPGFTRGPEGVYLAPAAAGPAVAEKSTGASARRIVIQVGPGLGRVEARIAD